ncbi:hypothetical protein GCM10027048_35880 [Hymenobacter coalescens]
MGFEVKGSADSLPNLKHADNVKSPRLWNQAPQPGSKHNDLSNKRPAIHRYSTKDDIIEVLIDVSRKGGVSFIEFSTNAERWIINQVRTANSSKRSIYIKTHKDYLNFKASYIRKRYASTKISDSIANIFTVIILCEVPPLKIESTLNAIWFNAYEKDPEYGLLVLNAILSAVKVYDISQEIAEFITEWVKASMANVTSVNISSGAADQAVSFDDIIIPGSLSVSDIRSFLSSKNLINAKNGNAIEFKRGKGQGRKSAFVAVYRVLEYYNLINPVSTAEDIVKIISAEFNMNITSKLANYQVHGKGNQTSDMFRKYCAQAVSWVESWAATNNKALTRPRLVLKPA